MLTASAIRFFLMLKSRGVSVVKLGDWFTSMSQALHFESMKISKPRTWKHMEFSRSSGFEVRYKWEM